MSVSYGGDSITFADGSTVTSGYTGGNKNLIINGDMRIDQRNAGTANTPSNNTYTLDRWMTRISGTTGASPGRLIIQQKDGANTSASNYESGAAAPGFTNSLKITCNSAFAAANTNDYVFITQVVEANHAPGLDWGLSTGKNLTLSFWVKSSLTGTYSIAIRSNNNYVAPYTILQANTWEYKTITIPAPSTSTAGQWNSGALSIFEMDFTLSLGTGYQFAANTWTASGVGNAIGVTGTTNFCATVGNTFYVTGVQLERGSSASSFEYLPYATQLALCQRYFEKSYQQNTVVPTNASSQYVELSVGTNTYAGGVSSAQQVLGSVFFKVTKRISPSITIYSYSNSTPTAVSHGWTGADFASNSGAINMYSDNSFSIYNATGSNITTGGYSVMFHYAASAEF